MHCGQEEYFKFFFNLGSAMISWCSKKQKCVAQSTAEAEYVAACSEAREVVWLRKLLSGLFGISTESTTIFCDNKSCVKISMNPVFRDKSKHIEIKYHYLRPMVLRKAVELKYISTNDQTADILTKPLPKVKFYFRDKLGMINLKT